MWRTRRLSASLCLVLSLLLLPSRCDGQVDISCDTLLPNTANAVAQTSTPPYRLTVTIENYTPSSLITGKSLDWICVASGTVACSLYTLSSDNSLKRTLSPYFRNLPLLHITIRLHLTSRLLKFMQWLARKQYVLRSS